MLSVKQPCDSRVHRRAFLGAPTSAFVEGIAGRSRVTARLNRRMIGGTLALMMLGIGGLLDSGKAADWPQYRGPQRDGVSLEKGVLTTWPAEGLDVLWKREVGEGYSAVAVARGRAYTMGLVNLGKDTCEKIWCLDAATGDVVWEHAYPAKATPYRGARSTPTVDGKAVYTYGANGQLLCLDAGSGKVFWQKDVQRDLGAKEPTYGYAASPIVVQGLVVVPVRIVAKDPKAKAGNPGRQYHRVRP